MSHKHIEDSFSNRDSSKLAAVILAGGSGTRFWPVSTSSKPKQFLKLFGDTSLIQECYLRIKDIIPPERILVLTNKAFVPLVTEQLPMIPKSQVIGEPVRRDTAAAVALGAVLAKKLFGDCTLVTLTADHKIMPVDVFQEVILSAAYAAAKSSALYTLGIVPFFPATGYGYLKKGEEIQQGAGPKHYKLSAFKEKPDFQTAVSFLKTGDYYWNSGMFAWHTDSICFELKKQLPGHLKAMQKALESYDPKEIENNPKKAHEWDLALLGAFEPLPRLSVDFGIMEHAADVRMCSANFQWIDVGGWLALEQFLDVDKAGNRFKGNLATYESSNNIVFNDNPEETVALVGTDNFVVVRAGNNTLVAPKHKLEEVKKLVENLPENLR